MNNNKMRKLTKRERKQQDKAKGLLLSCTVLSSFLILSSIASASDIEIYQQNSSSNTIMLMVDLSQSMGADPIADLQRDYPLCLSGGLLGNVTSLLGKVATVDINLLGLVKLDTGAPTDPQSCYIPSLLVTQILEGVDGITNPVLGADLLGLKGSVQYIKDSCELVERPPLAIAGPAYRCYNRLYRVKQAIHDVIDGNPEKGISALPDNVSVGLSVFPAMNASGSGKNELAGMIAVEAKPLDAAQRAKIKAKITEVSSVDPVTSLTTKVNDLVGKLLALDLVGVVLGALGTIPTLINDLKNLAGLSTPTATAYAETGAYLLSNTTKGTGIVEIGRVRKIEISLLGIGLIKIGEYQECSTYDVTGKCATWAASFRDGSLLGLGGNAPGWYKNKCTATNTTNCHDLPTTGTSLVGLELNEWKSFYRYNDDLQYTSAYSGFPASVATSKSGNRYVGPSTISNQCSAKGLYVLTGSIPDLDPNLLDGLLGGATREPFNSSNSPVRKLMSRSLNPSSNTVFNCGTVPSGWANGSSSATWNCIANYAGVLKDGTYNNGVGIKTGVGGIGRDFAHIPNAKTSEELGTIKAPTTVLSSLLGVVGNLLSALNAVLGLLGLDNLTNKLTKLLDNVVPVPLDPNHNADVANLARWGVHGGGGWYQLSSAQSIAEGILDFNQNLIEMESDPIGLQTLPADPLTPYRMTNDVYKSMFEPTEKASWLGNFKKYYTQDDNSVFKLKDAWSTNASPYDVRDWNKGGLLAKLESLKTSANLTGRTLLINRGCENDESGKARFVATHQLKTIDNHYLDTSNSSRCSLAPNQRDNANDEDYYLMSLLGYKLEKGATAVDLTEANRTNWQVGMNLHSTPIKLTQEATFNADSTINERKDYMLFGTTQGLLHVVDAKTGEETFAFVPNEMLENRQQRNAFLKEKTGVKANMVYGVDGAWTLYSEYVYGMQRVSSGSSSSRVVATVGEARNASGTTLKDNAGKVIKGKQVAYGGLRMGGRSYYALDLAKLNEPVLKFHIDPDHQRIINQDQIINDTNTQIALSQMGQSWSKPTITQVYWKGQLKRVMIVGGGYDARYENLAYSNQAGEKGAGVYMFDAENGELLWWASANAASSLQIDAMKYSVVSRINTADRNGDGLTDHLYFGDLGGQVWRIDFDANLGASSNKGFARLIFKNPTERFYEAPNFSVYGHEQPRAVISIASGNRSLPFSDRTSTSTIYNLFDREVIHPNFKFEHQTLTAKFTLNDLHKMDVSQLNGTALTLSDVQNSGNKRVQNGWYISAETVIGKQLDSNGNETTITNTASSKVLGEMVVMNKSLYASVYNPNGTSDSCRVQAQGITTVQRYCLPFGICELNVTDMSFGAGRGIVDVMAGVGTGVDEKNEATRQILNPNAKDSIVGGNGMPINSMRRQIVPLKWYESNE
ncbi:pilus assembly protein PilY [Acinetobacter pittii]|uniref:Pilus assembly protein PilY n=1 Tax=Acinetobacter haemolyticus TaxID=29430 RepID=A0AAW4J8H4_ACIHA|nr:MULTISPECIES: PilC/PilY family type IV pilus protein [Acinetobacter]MBN6532914.1 pilus assembly protein PilY [Acinetobacter pittii]MBO3657027.1 pilus assembly protein PilY [Acinetobacter haemolyticus]